MSLASSAAGKVRHASTIALPPALWDELRKLFESELEEAIWRWFDDNKEKVVFRKKVLWFRVEIKVAHCEELLEALLGDRPPLEVLVLD
jgi:hypothetical protein